jgi:hypothetical protein
MSIMPRLDRNRFIKHYLPSSALECSEESHCNVERIGYVRRVFMKNSACGRFADHWLKLSHVVTRQRTRAQPHIVQTATMTG